MMNVDPAEYIETKVTAPRITRWHRALSWLTPVKLTGTSEGANWFGVLTFRDTYTIRNGRLRRINHTETSFTNYRDVKETK